MLGRWRNIQGPRNTALIELIKCSFCHVNRTTTVLPALSFTYFILIVTRLLCEGMDVQVSEAHTVLDIYNSLSGSLINYLPNLSWLHKHGTIRQLEMQSLLERPSASVCNSSPTFRWLITLITLLPFHCLHSCSFVPFPLSLFCLSFSPFLPPILFPLYPGINRTIIDCIQGANYLISCLLIMLLLIALISSQIVALFSL